jgi:hypothetical protein
VPGIGPGNHAAAYRVISNADAAHRRMLALQQLTDASDHVAEIVVRASRMINNVSPSATSATLKAGELTERPLFIEQTDRLRV